MSDDDGIQAWAPIEVVEGLLKRAEQAEAVIQRVQVMAEAALAAHDELEGTYATVSAKALLNALNGDSDD